MGHMKPSLSSARIGVFILAMTFAVNWRLISAGFWVDDLTILRLIRPFSLPDAFSYWSPYWGWFYRPVYLTYFSLILAFWGPNAAAFHAIGLALHSLNMLLLWQLVFRITGKPRGAWLAVGLFFGATVNSDAVRWVAAASTLLATCFYLVCLHCWISYREQESSHSGHRHYLHYLAMAVLACGLALCSKEDAHSLPLIVALFDAMLFPGIPLLQRLRSYWPIAAVTLLYLPLGYLGYKNNTLFYKDTHFARSGGSLANIVQFWTEMSNSSGMTLPSLVVAGLVAFAVRGATQLKQGQRARMLLLSALAGSLFMPLETGFNDLPERFRYVPLLLMVLCIGSLGAQVQSNRATRMLLAAMSASLGAIVLAVALPMLTPMIQDDPLFVPLSLLLCVVACSTMLRRRQISLENAVPFATVLLLSQVHFYTSRMVSSAWTCVFAMAFAVALIARLGKVSLNAATRSAGPLPLLNPEAMMAHPSANTYGAAEVIREAEGRNDLRIGSWFWPTALSTALLWNTPPLSLPLYLILIATLEARQADALKGHRLTRDYA
jgi:hypothetical protein